MKNHRLAALLVACAALLPSARSAAFAQDDVDLEVVGNGAVKGTIRPAGERERFQVVLGRGAKVKAVAKAKAKKGPFVPSVEFVGPASDDALLIGTPKGRTASFRTAAPVAEGGPHAVRVLTGTGTDGDYVLAFTVTSQKAFSGAGTATPGETGIEVVFGAPAGAKARIVLAAKKSGFVPALDELVSPSAESQALTGSKAGPVVLTEAGDWKVRFHDGGAAGGAWTCKVVLALPKKRTSKIDISATALTGMFAEQQPVFGRYVAPDDGDTLLDPADTGSPIDGTSIMIPGGAMPFPVVVTLSQSEQFPPGDGNNPAGPAVQFGPDGLQFNSDATVTIPYDPAQFTDPSAELEVYVVHGDDGPEKIEPRSLLDFTVPGFVSFPVTGFSTFMAASSRPRPLFGTWIAASLTGTSDPDYGGSLRAVSGRVDFVPAAEVPEFYVSQIGLRTEWRRRQETLDEPFASSETWFESDNGTFTDLSSDGTRFELASVTDERNRVVRPPDGDVLVVEPSAEPSEVEISFALRAAEGSITQANIAGEWHVIGFTAHAENQGASPNTVTLSTEAVLGSATFLTDGRAIFTVPDFVFAETDYLDAPWRTSKRSLRGTGFVFISDGQGFAALPDGESETGFSAPFLLYAALDGDVLLGTRIQPGDEAGLFVFVRQGKSLGKKSLDGKADFLTLARIQAERAAAGSPQALQTAALVGSRTHDGLGGVDVSGAFGAVTAHDVEGSSFVGSSSEPAATTEYTISSTGVYRETGGFRGVITRSGQAVFGLSTPAGRAAFTLIVPGLDWFTRLQ